MSSRDLVREIREPSTKHSISLQQVERWLAGATTNPNEASRKVKLKMMLHHGLSCTNTIAIHVADMNEAVLQSIEELP